MRKNFCSAPWSSLAIDPDGSSKVCCVSKDAVEFNNVDECKYDSTFVEIRQSFIDDKQHPNCINCWQEEKSNPDQWISRRSMFQYEDFYNNLNDSMDFKLEYLDARWSNHCNLSCVYCGPNYSSTWAKILGKKQRTTADVQFNKKDLKHVKNLLLAGGEPFLIKENIKLLEKMLKVNPGVEIEVTSNLTFNRTNKVVKLLEEFSNVTVIASFESIGDRFEYIRNGADWNIFKENLQYCSEHYKLQANMVYFSLSLLEICETIRFAQQFISDDEIYIRYEASGADFHQIEANNLETIKNKVSEDAVKFSQPIKSQLENLLLITKSNSAITNLTKLDKFDQLTGKDHRKIFPELYHGV